MNFIPAKESRFLIWFFDLYTRWLIKRRFKSVWIKQSYKPVFESRSVYFINHNMWWDGLIPLYLSRKILHQQARAVMEDQQMQKHRFFSRIGAFSINLSDSRSTLRTLRYAVESINRDKASLYIYPEGELTPVSEAKPEFKKGLAWLYQNMDDEIDFVPIAFYSHTFRDSKPELYINIGSPISYKKTDPKEELTKEFETAVHELLRETREVAGLTDTGFKES